MLMLINFKRHNGERSRTKNAGVVSQANQSDRAGCFDTDIKHI